jgi:hypothetical protein
MDTTQDRGTEDNRVEKIRREIEITRARLAETIDALRYKADLPARLGEMLSAAAEGVATHVLQRLSMPHEPQDAEKEAARGSTPPTSAQGGGDQDDGADGQDDP